MALNETRRLTQSVLFKNRMTLISIQTLSDYAPTNPMHSPTALAELYQAVEKAQQEEIRTQNAAAAAREAAVAAEWALHNALLGAKAQIVAQYGHDADAVQAIGLKKKSNRKRPTRRSSSS
jgi:hypothetical protein